MRKIKYFFVRIGLILGSIFGVQYARPPVLETTIPVETTTTPPPVVTPDPNGPTYSLGTIRNATDAEKEMIIKAVNMDNDVVTDNCFEIGVLKTEFTETNGLTNGQILNEMAHKKHVLNFEFFDGSWKQNYVYKTMGYDIGDGVVYMNRFYVQDAKTIMSLSLHEAAHAKGFHHYGRFTGSSVPYKMNEISEACIAVE